MRVFLSLFVLAFAFAAPAFAQDAGRQPPPPLSIALGEILSLRVDDTAPGGYVVVGRAPLGEFGRSELDAAQQAAGWTSEQAGGVNSMSITAPEGNDFTAIEPGVVRMRFGRIPGHEQVMLVIENGYGDAFAYRAIQHVDGAASATDVCWTLPGRRNFEHWPYIIESIDLSNIHLYPWTDMEARPPCQ